jgi:hypothetical protein
MLVLILLPAGFGLNVAEQAECPKSTVGNAFSGNISLSGCNLSSPAGEPQATNPWLSITNAGQEGLVEVSDSTFTTLLLLFLLKRKKKEIAQSEETVETVSKTITEDDAYITEYGLSDLGQSGDPNEDDEDLPQPLLEEQSEDGGQEGFSERNPDEN